jgi:hypothetical protein
MRVAAMCWCLVFLTGCASIPDVEYTYYPSKMHGVATITETVSCVSNLRDVVISSSAVFVPTYSADIQAGWRRISIRRFEGSFAGFADSDANFSFYDDGRLKSINQSTTGQGETIIKSLVSVGTTFSGVIAPLADTKKPPEPTGPCKTVIDWTTPPKAASTTPLAVCYLDLYG